MRLDSMKRIFGLAVAILMAVSIADCKKQLDQAQAKSILKDWFKARAAVDPACKQQKKELLKQSLDQAKVTREQWAEAQKTMAAQMQDWNTKFKQKFCAKKEAAAEGDKDEKKAKKKKK